MGEGGCRGGHIILIVSVSLGAIKYSPKGPNPALFFTIKLLKVSPHNFKDRDIWG